VNLQEEFTHSIYCFFVDTLKLFTLIIERNYLTKINCGRREYEVKIRKADRR